MSDTTTETTGSDLKVTGVELEPSKDSTPINGDDTPADFKTGDEPVSKESTNALASKKARAMGEDRKVLLDAMISAAEQSDSAKEALFKQLDSRSSLKEVAEDKFGDRLNALRGVRATKEETLTTEDLKMQAKAELYIEMEVKEQKEMVTNVAEKLGMNQQEADKLQKLAKAYAQTAGIGFDAALIKVAQAEKPSHAHVLGMPSGANLGSASINLVSVTEEDKRLASQVGKKPEWVAQQRASLKEFDEKGTAFIQL